MGIDGELGYATCVKKRKKARQPNGYRANGEI
jgi:hypothetical protein